MCVGKALPDGTLFTTPFVEIRMSKAGQKTGYGADAHGNEQAFGITEKIAESA